MAHKWVDGKKWDKKSGKFKHVCRLGPNIAMVIAINGMGRAEWRYGTEFGYADSVKEAKGVIAAKLMARRLCT